MVLLSFFFSFLVFLNIIGYGILLENFSLKKSDFLLTYFIKGACFLIFVSLLINFFTPLNTFITNAFFFVGILISIFFLIKESKFNFFLEIFLISLLVALITYKSFSYNDYELYHLPYTEILRNSKIIYGLSNFDPRYGHVSIFQNISTMQYNFLMGLDSYIFFTSISIFILMNHILKIFLKTKKNIIFFICVTTISYYLMHANRYGALGNDMPAHIFSLLSFILFFEIIFSEQNKQNENFKIFIYSILVASLAKITLLLNFLLLIPILFFDKKIISNNLKLVFFIFFISLLFFYKNYINTSCLIYPIKISCVKTEWSAEKYDFTSPEFISKMSSVMVKEFMNTNILQDQKLTSKILNNSIKNEKSVYKNLTDFQKKNFFFYHVYDYYDQVNIWTKPYMSSHFKRKIFGEVLSLLFVNLLIFFCAYLFIKRQNKNIDKFNKFEFFFILLIFFSTFMWFIKAPILRYGISYVLIFLNIPFLLLLKKVKQDIDFSNILKKIYKILFVILLFFLIIKNILRISSAEISKDYTDNIVPIKKPYHKEIIKDNYSYNIPISGICSNTPPLCTVYGNEFEKGDFHFFEDNNYLIIKK